MEVIVTYEQSGQFGKVAVFDDAYDPARDEAFAKVPEDAVVTSIRVDRD